MSTKNYSARLLAAQTIVNNDEGQAQHILIHSNGIAAYHASGYPVVDTFGKFVYLRSEDEIIQFCNKNSLTFELV